MKFKFKKLNLFFALIILMGVFILVKNKSKEKAYEINYNYQVGLQEESNIKGEKTKEILEMTKINLNNLEKNFFTTKTDPDHQWFSVAKEGYNGQFYARDTFVSFLGGVYGGEYMRGKLAYTIDWFSQYMDKDGYLPIWFSQSEDDLNIYWYCPYNRDAANGGIKQYDHLMQYTDAIWQIYSWEGDKNWLKEKLPFARKAWKWLAGQTDKNHLIKSTINEYCGADWADQIRRGGYSTFVEVYWYKTTLDLAYMERATGNIFGYFYYFNYARNIKNEINQKLWKVSRPIGYDGEPFGHYVGWIDEKGVKDYFEVDSNAFAVGVGIAKEKQVQEIMKFINSNFDHFVNKKGAARVLYGNYGEEATAMAKNVSQNGSYWYLTNYFLAMAYHKMKMPEQLNVLLERVKQTTIDSQEEGLAEWYYEDGKVGGAKNYSWSLAYPLFLFYGEILGIKPLPNSLIIEPCISQKIGEVQTTFKYQGKIITVSLTPTCNKSLEIINKEIKDGMLIRWKN